MFDNERPGSAPLLCGENMRTIRSIVPVWRPSGARPSCLSTFRHTGGYGVREGVEGFSGVWRARSPLPVRLRALWASFECECSTPRRFESGRGVETQRSYLGEIVLPGMGSGRAKMS